MKDQSIPIKTKDYKNIYILSDLHLNHDRPWIVDQRNFKNINEHNKFIEDWLYTRDPEDLIINLGDSVLSQSEEYALNLFKNIPCTQYYIFGNHESFVHRIYKNAKESFFETLIECDSESSSLDEYDDINLFPLNVEIEDGLEEGDLNPIGYPFRMSSLPYKGGNTTIFLGESATFKVIDGRHHNAVTYLYCRHMAPTIWDKMKNDNFVCCCGHSHGNYPNINVEHKVGKILDCGVDNAKKYNGTPAFTFQEVCAIMKTKEALKVDHH